MTEAKDDRASLNAPPQGALGGKVRKLQTLAAVLFATVIALSAFTEAANKLYGTVRDLFKPDPLRGIPAREDFEEWAEEFARAAKEENPSDNVPKARDPALVAASSASAVIYRKAVQTLRAGCLAYRRENATNLYVDLPEMPENNFGSDAAGYRGSVIFSRYRSWFVHMSAPREGDGRIGPIFTVEIMDGDGSVRGARAIGSLKLCYDFDHSNVRIKIDGCDAAISNQIPKTVPPADFERAFAYTVKLLIEQGLRSHDGNNTCSTPKSAYPAGQGNLP